MQIVPIINKRLDTLRTAIPRKAANDTLSPKTQKKLAFIANRDFKCGAGAAFTGRPVAPPPRSSSHAQLQLESLRSTLTAQRLTLERGTCLHHYLGEVLKRLPCPHVLESPRQRTEPAPTQPNRVEPGTQEKAPLEPPADYRMQVAFAADTRRVDGGNKARRTEPSRFSKPTPADALRHFEEAMQYARAEQLPAGKAVSPAELHRYWVAALADLPTMAVLESSPYGQQLKEIAVAALQHDVDHVGSRVGSEWSASVERVPEPVPKVPGVEELLRVIEARDSGVSLMALV